MANWEYKVISSGKHGMATMAALEQHLNELGQQQWEIINWHTAPDNPLLFTGLARRPILRDWKPDEMPAAQEAARLEKVEEHKEREAWRETLKAELEFLTDDREEESDPEADREDLLDVLRPLMKRSQRGPGAVGSLTFLARKLDQDEADLIGALAEVGLPLEEDPQAVPPSLQHDDEFFWLNKNARGEVWLNSGPKAPAVKAKPEPRPERQTARQRQEARAVVARDEGEAEVPAEAEVDQPVSPSPEAAPAAEAPAPARREAREPRDNRGQRESRDSRDQRDGREARGSREPREPAQSAPAAPLPEGEALLDKLRPMMRRNRRGRGWSGSTSFLSRALRHSEEALMAAFAQLGLLLTEDPQAKPIFVELNGFLYWLNRGQGGQIWINAREQRAGEAHSTGEEGEGSEHGAVPAEAERSDGFASRTFSDDGAAPGAEPVSEPAPTSVAAAPAEPAPEAPASDDGSLFGRIRPHFTKNKRSASFSAAPGSLADALGVSQADLVEALVKAGLEVPETEKSKPVFAEYADEIFWFNRNAKDELWLNAKAKPARKAATGSRSGGRSGGGRSGGSRAKKSTDSGADPAAE